VRNTEKHCHYSASKIDGRKNASAIDLLNELIELVASGTDILTTSSKLLGDIRSKPYSTIPKLQNLAPLKSRKKATVVRPAEATKVEKPKSAGGGGAPKVTMTRGAGWQKRK
jgi:hypothetical protein